MIIIIIIYIYMQIIKELKSGAALALVSDAGMPAINDPGSQLIATAIHEDIPVIPIPGPSATLTVQPLVELLCGEWVVQASWAL